MAHRRTGWTRYNRHNTVAAPRNYFSRLFDDAGRYLELQGELWAVMPTGFDRQPYKLMSRDGRALHCWRDLNPKILRVHSLGAEIALLDADTLELILPQAAATEAAPAVMAECAPAVTATLYHEQRLIDAGRNAELAGVRDWRLASAGVKLRGLEQAILRDGLSQAEIANYTPALKAARAEYARRVLVLMRKELIATLDDFPLSPMGCLGKRPANVTAEPELTF